MEHGTWGDEAKIGYFNTTTERALVASVSIVLLRGLVLVNV